MKESATTESYTYCHSLSLHDALPICPWAVHLVVDRAADGAAMLHEPPRAFECDRIALRAIGKADQLDDRARMLEEIAAHDALPGRPLGVKAKVIDTLGMEVGARERLEIGPVDDRIVFEEDRKSTRLKSSHSCASRM